MVKQGACNHEIVETFLNRVVKNIDTAHLKTWPLQSCDIRQIDVAGNHLSCRLYLGRQSDGDRSVPTAEFKATPALTHSQPRNANPLHGIEQCRHKRQALFFPDQAVGQCVFTHRFLFLRTAELSSRQ
jgi:hypothetical protein